MDLLTTQITGALIVAAVIGLGVRRSRRSEQIVQEWAQKNNYRLLDSRNMFLSPGPFFWKKSKQQTVFRVLLRDKDGNMKNAWILCGSWWGRLTVDNIEVRWDN